MKDLEKNDQTGLIRLFEPRGDFENTEAVKRLKLLQKDIISYFRSRNEDSLKKSIPAINTSISNSKSRISSSDVVRPSNTLPASYQTYWTKNINQTHNDSSEHAQLQDTRSEYHANELNSISIDIPDDSYYHKSTRRNYLEGYLNPDLLDQYLYDYDEERISYPLESGEISF